MVYSEGRRPLPLFVNERSPFLVHPWVCLTWFGVSYTLSPYSVMNGDPNEFQGGAISVNMAYRFFTRGLSGVNFLEQPAFIHGKDSPPFEGSCHRELI